MIVICDTSPVNYLVWIGKIEVLRAIFGGIVIPKAVMSELRHERAPVSVQRWAQNPPQWVEVRQAGAIEAIDNLGPGECEALSLARELSAELVILDDSAARGAASQRGLTVSGTLGVLEIAAARGLLNLQETLAELCGTTSFRIAGSLVEAALQRDAARRG